MYQSFLNFFFENRNFPFIFIPAPLIDSFQTLVLETGRKKCSLRNDNGRLLHDLFDIQILNIKRFQPDPPKKCEQRKKKNNRSPRQCSYTRINFGYPEDAGRTEM